MSWLYAGVPSIGSGERPRKGKEIDRTAPDRESPSVFCTGEISGVGHPKTNQHELVSYIRVNDTGRSPKIRAGVHSTGF